MDKFQPYQLIQVASGGNHKIREYFKQHGVSCKRKDAASLGSRVDYFSKHATKLFARLEKESEARAEALGYAYKPQGSPCPSPPMPAPVERSQTEEAPAPRFNKLGLAPMSGSGLTPLKPALDRRQTAPAEVDAERAEHSNGSALTPPRTPPIVVHHQEEKPAPRVFAPVAQAKTTAKLDDDFDFDFDELEKELKTGVAKPSPAPKLAPAQEISLEPRKMIPIRPRPIGGAGYPSTMGTHDGASWQKPEPKPLAEPKDAFGAEVNAIENKMRMQQFSTAGSIFSSQFFGEGDESPDSKWDTDLIKDRLSDGIATGRALVGMGLSKLQEYRNNR